MTPYIHYKNKKKYNFKDHCKIQVNAIWIDACIYYEHNVTPIKYYVRPLKEFHEKFKKEKD
jgi:hypothetical protein